VPGIALFPLGIDIGCVNEIAVVFGVSIENRHRLLFLGAPAKYISAKAERVDFQVGLVQCDMSHAEKFIALY